MVCIVPLAPIFSSPDLMSEQIDELLYGDRIEILEDFGNFYKIKTDYRYKGWVVKSNLAKYNVKPNCIVSAPFCDLLLEDRNYYRAAITLPFGAKLFAEGEDNGSRYTVAVMQNRKRYYLQRESVRPIRSRERNEKKLREAIVRTALSYVGTQYRWGGRTHIGIDCSGLCFNAYRFNGIDIWRDADIERSNLKRIPLDSAKLGDLLYFKGHIALYLGSGDIVHSSASRGRVVVEKLEENNGLKEIFISAGTAFNEYLY